MILVSLLGLGVGLVYSANLERSYSASAVVLLNPIPANPLTPEAASGSGAQLTVALETEAEVVATPSIAEGVSAVLGRLVANDEEVLDVQVPAGTQMVQISFTSTSPTEARDGAQAFAEVYLDYRQERATSSAESSLATLRAESEEIEAGLQRALSESEEGNSLASREVDLYVDRLAVVNSRISTEESASTDPGHVLQPAQEPATSNEPAAALILAATGGLALAVSILLAMYREWRRDVVGETADAEVASLPVFATLPASPAFLTEPGDAAREGYRQLRAAVVANAPRPHVFAVTPISTSQEGSEAASNLGLVLAEAGFSVLLLAADPEDRQIEEYLGLDSTEPGLSDLVMGTEVVSSAVVHHRGVDILPGGDASNAQQLYAGPRLRDLIDELRGRYDYLIVSTAAAGSASGDAVASIAGTALLVLSAGNSTRAQVGAALERYGRLGVHGMGAVILRGGRGQKKAPRSASISGQIVQTQGSHVGV